MKTRAVRLYGKNDLRLEEFELPPIREDEILAKVVSDSLCLSTYKAAIQGSDHKRVPSDIAEKPVMVGHECCGEIIEVGAKWQHQFKAGDMYSIQPALNYNGTLFTPGYSYQYIGGNATYIIIPNEVMELGCLLKFDGSAYFYGSLAEPMSCCIGAFHANYHTTPGSYQHKMDIVEGGNMAILAGAGPMGLGAIDYAINGPINPKLLVVTDIDDGRLDRANEIISFEVAAKKGIELHYVNSSSDKALRLLMDLSYDKGYDDVFVFAPVASVVEMGDALLARDGCLNFFAGPTDANFSAKMNFYDVHYDSTHIVGTSGGNTADMREALQLMSDGKINPAAMFSHIGGLDAAIDATMNLYNMRAGKVLIYTHLNMPLTAIVDMPNLYPELAPILAKTNGIWSPEAERFLLNTLD